MELERNISQEIKWGNRIKILGIHFDSENYDNKDKILNFDPAIAKMKKTSSSWMVRNLSLKGRIVILNTLVLPIIYFQSTMLAITQKTIKEIGKLIANFLWRGKKSKISKVCLEKTTGMGGLGLHNIQSRIKAAKMAWLKRLTCPATEPWQYYLEFKSDQTGYELAIQRKKHKRLERIAPFYGQILKYWRELYQQEPGSEQARRNEWLWGNPFLKGKVKKKHETFCRNLGINKIHDLLLRGKILMERHFEERFHCTPLPNLLECWQNTIPVNWLNTMSSEDPIMSTTNLYVKNHKAEWVDIPTMPAKLVYTALEQNKPKGYTCADRWVKAYGGEVIFESEHRWRVWSVLPYQITHEVQLQSFAYKIMYRIIPCRVYRKQLRVLDNDKCGRCAEKEDIFHLFFECQVVKRFWDSLATWLGGKSGIDEFPEDLAEEEFLLGVIEREGDFSLFNYIILFAKFFIYKTTIFNLGEPELFQFLSELKSRLTIERLTCFSEGSFTRRFKKWDRFYQDL